MMIEGYITGYVVFAALVGGLAVIISAGYDLAIDIYKWIKQRVTNGPRGDRGFQVVSTYEQQEINLPKRQTLNAAGYDFECAEDVTLEPHKVTLVPTGVKAYMQTDEYLGLHIRSGLAVKQQLSLINSQGIIDADYYNNPDNEGHIVFAIVNHSNTLVELQKGQRIGQGIFYKYLLAANDSPQQQRKGGLGSTGDRA